MVDYRKSAAAISPSIGTLRVPSMRSLLAIVCLLAFGTYKSIQLIRNSVRADQRNRPMWEVLPLPADQMADFNDPTDLIESYRCLPDTIDPRGPKGE